MNTQPTKIENQNSAPIFTMKWWRGIFITNVTCGGRQPMTDFEHRTDKPDLVIGAAGLAKETYAFGGGFDFINRTARRAVYINWQDFGVPDMDKSWWENLYESIEQIKPRHIHVQCMGGMGRTGTILTILLILSRRDKKDAFKTVGSAIQYIRAHGNPHAVETPAQRQYIADMTGTQL